MIVEKVDCGSVFRIIPALSGSAKKCWRDIQKHIM